MKIRCPRLFLAVLFLFSPSLPLFSQNQPPVRDDRAVKIVEGAINTMGAANSASAIQDCVVTGTSESESNPDQQKDFTWTIAGDEFRVESMSTKGNGIFVSGHGKPARMSNDGTVSRINYHVARAHMPYFLPGLLLSRELANPKYTVKYVGTASVGGHRALQVHLIEVSDKVATFVTPQEWYFDLNSGLPLRVEFHIPTNENAADIMKGSYEFSDFRSVSGMLTPFQISFSQEHLPLRTINITSVKFNVGVSPSVFDTLKGVEQ